MPDPTFTITAEFTFRVEDEQTARNRLALYTAGIPDLIGTRITAVAEGSERSYEDDCAPRNGRALDRDDGQPVSEEQLLEGYGAEIDERVHREPVPHALRRDLGVDR